MRLLPEILKFCFVLALFLPAQAGFAGEGELVPGQTYDFFCKDGQHFRNAEFVSQDKSGYLIKISYSAQEKRIAKEDLLFPPRPSTVEPAVPPNRLTSLSLGAEFGQIQGSLTPFFDRATHALLQFETEFYPGIVAKYWFFPSPIVVAEFGEYRGTSRSLSGGSVSGGLTWAYSLAEKWPSLVFGITGGYGIYNLKANTFTEPSRAGVFAFTAGIRFRLANIITTIFGREVMFADPSAALYSGNLGILVGYAF